MRNKGFTMMELVVVMAIIAILAAMLVPAVNRARKKAAINKAEAEMASLASTGGMIKLDIGYYVPLEEHTLTDADISTNWPAYPVRYTLLTAAGKEDFNTIVGTETVPPYSSDTELRDVWDGPYTTWQDSQIYSSTNGALLSLDTGVTGWGDITPAGPPPDDADDARYGAPLDPWNHPYVLAYSTAKEVMVVYSAGPDGKLQTNPGAIIKGDLNLDGDNADAGEFPNSDDLLYKFK